jgi:hypothetical protein
VTCSVIVIAIGYLVREDSRRATNPAIEKAQLVEPLDFELRILPRRRALGEGTEEGIRGQVQPRSLDWGGLCALRTMEILSRAALGA